MATSYFGTIGPYEVEKGEEFSNYIERIEQFFIVNNVTEENKKAAILLSVIGAETYAIVKNLSSPETTSSKTFEQLCIILKSHYEPKTLVIAERFKFHSRDQGEIESAQHFFNEFKHLSKTCEFGQFLDEAIRDRFVCGLYDDNIQKRLLSEKDLTATKALTTAAAWEKTNKNMSVIKEQSTMVVKKIMKEDKPCFRCKKLGHKPENYRFKNATC